MPLLRLGKGLCLALLLSRAGVADTVKRNFSWTYGGKLLTFSISFDDSLYKACRALPRVRSDYTAYCLEPSQQQMLQFIISKFRAFSKSNGWNDSQTISMMIGFVQSLPYTSDDVTTKFDEYPRYPVETLVDNGGDCEDTSILLAALLNAMKYDVVLLASKDHMAVGVGVPPSTPPLGDYAMTMLKGSGRTYAFLETTGNGFQIGQCPPGVSVKQFRHMPLVVKALLDMDVKTENGNGSAIFKITVRNRGSAVAPVFVQGWFDTEQPNGRSQANRSQEFDLQPGMEVKIDLPCPYPEICKRLRVNVEAVDRRNSSQLKLWQSQWVTP